MLVGMTMSFLLIMHLSLSLVNMYANMHMSCSCEAAPKHIGVVSLGKIQLSKVAKNVS